MCKASSGEGRERCWVQREDIVRLQEGFVVSSLFAFVVKIEGICDKDFGGRTNPVPLSLASSMRMVNLLRYITPSLFFSC